MYIYQNCIFDLYQMFQRPLKSWGASTEGPRGPRVGCFKNKFFIFFQLKKKKIGQCSISSTVMTFVFTYKSHKQPKMAKMAKKSNFFLLTLRKKIQKCPKKIYLLKFEDMLLSEIKFRRQACLRILEKKMFRGTFLFFYERQVLLTSAVKISFYLIGPPQYFFFFTFLFKYL